MGLRIKCDFCSLLIIAIDIRVKKETNMHCDTYKLKSPNEHGGPDSEHLLI